MKLKRITVKILLMLLITFMNLNAQDIKISVGDVKDSRTTGEFFAGLEVDLKIFGDVLENAKSMRCTILKAVDEMDRDLVKEEERTLNFSDLDKDSPDRADLTLKLKNPSRKAMTIKEIAGEVELYIPKNDPNAIVTIKNFTSQSGKPISNPGLKASNIELSILTTTQYEQLKKKQEQATDTADVMGQMVKALAGLFGGMSEPGQNSIILQLKDPDAMIINVEFLDQKGKEISSQGSMNSEDIQVYDFEKAMPKNAQIQLNIMTSQAIKKIPFTLKDIMLP
ncbi:MAG: hypothetical protein NTX22_15445 [Ignavibacteriales bacterium]|nr:hypothetical protein [Ignavibacteriales bacterium]